MKIITTLRELRAAFDADDALDDWKLCIDSGRFYLMYIGTEDVPDDPAVKLEFCFDYHTLIEELCDLAGIPAEQA